MLDETYIAVPRKLHEISQQQCPALLTLDMRRDARVFLNCTCSRSLDKLRVHRQICGSPGGLRCRQGGLAQLAGKELESSSRSESRSAMIKRRIDEEFRQQQRRILASSVGLDLVGHVPPLLDTA